MTERMRVICSHLPAVGTLADVGCDHGYMTKYALDHGLCERAYVSDVSAESLSKAEKLLEREIADGRCFSVCADGLEGLPEPPDCVLIAGMGGEEIVRILSRGIPQQFVLQPMKNADKVRAFLLRNGCGIVADYTFSDGKWYDLIVGFASGDSVYTDWEIAFGRDNLKNPTDAFLRKIRKEQRDLRNALASPALSVENRDALRKRLYDLEEITDAIDGDL